VKEQRSKEYAYGTRGPPQPDLAPYEPLRALRHPKKRNVRRRCRESFLRSSLSSGFLGIKDRGAGKAEEPHAAKREYAGNVTCHDHMRDRKEPAPEEWIARYAQDTPNDIGSPDSPQMSHPWSSVAAWHSDSGQ
jgi:hypothetical protein